jgi:hypothetical protein
MLTDGHLCPVIWYNAQILANLRPTDRGPCTRPIWPAAMAAADH